MSLLRYIAKINILLWILGFFIFHALLYFFLGTPNWLFTTFFATLTWAIILLIVRGVSRAIIKDKEPV